MTHPLGLDALLIALREAGLGVGVNELLRLQRVFALQPDLGSDSEHNQHRLKAILRAVLVKNTEERATFERVYEGWLARADQELLPLSKPVPGKPVARAEPGGQPQYLPPVGRRWWLAVIALALLVAVAMDVYRVLRPAPPLLLPGTRTVQSEPSEPEPSSPADLRQRRFISWVPTLSVTPAEPVGTGWPALVLGAGALLAAGGLWFTLGRRRRLPEPEPKPTRSGPPRVFLRPPRLSGPQLLDVRQQEILVWGIGRFIADEPSRRLDLGVTVAATARRGGIPELHFQRTYYQREVWLWLDETTDDSALARLADEVEAVLKLHGLAVERAAFRGVPERLVTAAGAVFAPWEIDERRDLAIVAVLTDGRVLTRQYAADDRRVRIDALLRGLSHWPRLAFVDFSKGANPLARILAQHDLERIEPVELAGFLGGTSAAPVPGRYTRHDDAAWAAACALAPTSVDEATALELRRRLGLAASPWALHALRAEAPGPAGRLQWTPSLRARRINWLRETEGSGSAGIASGSLLDRALRFWEEKYEKELADRKANDAQAPWEDTPACQHLRMERDFVQLWRLPAKTKVDAEAIVNLYRLHQGHLKEVIKEQMGQLRARRSYSHPQKEEVIELPWSWAERSATERAMLQKMGFGGDMPKEHLGRSGRLWLGLGVCLGLAVGGFLAAFLHPVVPPIGQPVFVHGKGRPGDAEDRAELMVNGRWQVSVTTPQWTTKPETAESAALVNVVWQREERNCIERLGDGAELWRCGLAARPARLSEDIRRSLVVLAAAPEAAGVEDLAAALLTGGSADVVLVDGNWPRHRALLLSGHESLGLGHQLLVITAGAPAKEVESLLLPSGERSALLQAADWAGLAKVLRFTGVRALTEVWPKVRIVAGNPAGFLLGGVGGCRPGGQIEEQGMVFVRICPGTFMMGSTESKDEMPVHQVILGEFWIGRHEVTNAQYRRFYSDHKGENNLPAVDVSWNDAKAFCEQSGHRLPTEAEWEYAARAGTQTRWSFGDDEKDLGRYAWYDGNSGNRAHPVGTREPNLWGLHDMHGNVWEWVQDCWHGSYDGAPADGSAWEGGDCWYRVLRGGSFGRSARFLRSMDRNGYWPENRNPYFGFRCARGPRRQP